MEPHLSELAAVPLFNRHLGAGPDDDAVDVAGHERREAGHRSERHGLLGEEDEVDRLRRPDPGPSLRAWTGVFLPLDPEDQDSSPGTQVLPVVVDDAGPDAYCQALVGRLVALLERVELSSCRKEVEGSGIEQATQK